MSVLIVLFKKELAKHEGLGHQLSKLSKQVKELEEACIYVPQAGSLLSVSHLLRTYEAKYSIMNDSESIENYSGKSK